MMITTLLMSILMVACAVPQPEVTASTAQRHDFREREETNQKFQLGSGARVEVSSIRGHVEITNSDSATAEVQIIRTARTRADLEYHKIEVQHEGNSLVVRGVEEPDDRQRRNIQVNHQIVLKLPRSIDLKISSISGHLTAGDVDGETRVSSVSGNARIGNVGGKLRVSSISGNLTVGNVGADASVKSISGNLRLAQVNGSLDATSISGSLTTILVSLSPQGIHLNSISGSVEIVLKGDVNADFSANGVSGQVYLDVPNVVRDLQVREPNVRARIGAGGTPIEITSVSGNIRLTRA